jgi:2-oxoglutarate ferredoxin oxidoreductase subunit alpha
MTECDMDAAKLTPVLHYDGTPITARFIAGAIAAKLGAKNAQAQRSAAGNS